MSQICSKGSLSYFQPILAAIYVTIAMVNVKLILHFYTWAVVLINQEEEIDEKQLLSFGLKRGAK